jgi:hypothetical protein
VWQSVRHVRCFSVPHCALRCLSVHRLVRRTVLVRSGNRTRRTVRPLLTKRPSSCRHKSSVFKRATIW